MEWWNDGMMEWLSADAPITVFLTKVTGRRTRRRTERQTRRPTEERTESLKEMRGRIKKALSRTVGLKLNRLTDRGGGFFYLVFPSEFMTCFPYFTRTCKIRFALRNFRRLFVGLSVCSLLGNPWRVIRSKQELSIIDIRLKRVLS